MTASLTVTDEVLLDFAAEVGAEEAVVAEGARTAWEVGGSPAPAARLVRAPHGVVDYVPEEMLVVVRAGTTVTELADHLAEHGQRTNLVDRGGTVGGALAVGRSDIHRLGRGPVRDDLLQCRYVTAEGRVATAGGPTVKNVTGFDLCRLLVGSLGTLGLIAEVTLRTRPLAPEAGWIVVDDSTAGAATAACRLTTASSVLWDGERTWIHLEGHRPDVEADRSRVEGTPTEAAGPPSLPAHRRRCSPSEIPTVAGAGTGGFVAEVGVGLVHTATAGPPPAVDDGVRALNQAVKEQFDPTGRLGAGRDPLAA